MMLIGYLTDSSDNKWVGVIHGHHDIICDITLIFDHVLCDRFVSPYRYLDDTMTISGVGPVNLNTSTG